MIYDCNRPHYYYRAATAYSSYVERLKSSHEGISMTRQEILELDCLLTPLLRQGQSIAHIYATHGEEIPCSVKTLYNYIDKGVFTARNIDLPKKVKYKARKKKRQEPEQDYACRKNRTYQDFQNHTAAYADAPVIEMDTVHGSRQTGKVMLTMLFRNSSFMLIFLMEDCTQNAVREVFDMLTEKLRLDEFKKIFPVILTDNGSEFKAAEELERTRDGKERTRIFYCDPLASWQKAKLEKSHEYIRRVLPKGKALDDYKQEDMTLLANHINSTARKSLNGRTPFELSELLNSDKLLELLQLKKIEADCVTLTPVLLKNKQR